MNCLIILNGKKASYDILKDIVEKSNYIICADGGAKWAYDAEIKIDAVIGDFDSLDEDDLNRITSYNVCYTKLLREGSKEFEIVKPENDEVLTKAFDGVGIQLMPNIHKTSGFYIAKMRKIK